LQAGWSRKKKNVIFDSKSEWFSRAYEPWNSRDIHPSHLWLPATEYPIRSLIGVRAMRPDQLRAKLDALAKQFERDIAKFEKETGERISGVRLARAGTDPEITLYLWCPR
jgi:hypothetical protein